MPPPEHARSHVSVAPASSDLLALRLLTHHPHCLPLRIRITLCIETGVQNLALTLALVALSFNNKFSIVVYSYIFGLVICIECLVFVGFTRMPYIRRHACGVDPEDVEEPQPVPNVSVGENLDGDPEGFRPDSASLSESKAVAVKAEPEPQRKRSFFSWA